MLFIFMYFSYLNLSSHCCKANDLYICHWKCNKIGTPDTYIQAIPLTFYAFTGGKHSKVYFTLDACSCVRHYLSQMQFIGSPGPSLVKTRLVCFQTLGINSLVPSSYLWLFLPRAVLWLSSWTVQEGSRQRQSWSILFWTLITMETI